MSQVLPWVIVVILLAVIGYLWWRDRRRCGSLGDQARDLAKTNKDAAEREGRAAVDGARVNAEAAISESRAELEGIKNVDGNLADYIRGRGGSC